jgi:hypothetical protein
MSGFLFILIARDTTMSFAKAEFKKRVVGYCCFGVTGRRWNADDLGAQWEAYEQRRADRAA